MADGSPAGWKTVQEYQSNDIADDSDDEKKIRSAENRALRNSKQKKSRFQPYLKYGVTLKPVPSAAAGYAAQLSALALQQTNTLQTNAGASNSFNQPFRSGSRRTPHPATSAIGASRLGIGRPDVHSTSPQVQIPSDLDDKYLLSVDMFERITDNEIMNEHCKLLSIIESNQLCTGVKNILQNHYEFLRKIGAFEDILKLIKTGYNIPFAVNPPRIYLKNNKSALQNFSFVTESIGDLVKSGCVVQVPFRPFVVSPLSVAENREKKRLILDLSMLNGFLKKEKIKFEDHKLALQYFEKIFFLY